MKPTSFFLAIVCLTATPWLSAQSVSERLQNIFNIGDQAQESEILHPDQAFVLSASASTPDQINVVWQIAEGHYLYHDKFNFEIDSGDVSIDKDRIIIPDGKIKEDPSFGSVEVNVGETAVDVPLLRQTSDETTITLNVGYQGCKEDTLCYPPIQKTVSVLLPAVNTKDINSDTSIAKGIAAQQTPKVSEQDSITQKLIEGRLLGNVLFFFGAGLLLSFTPCVFPMVPILSGILVGQGERITQMRGLSLSLIYVLAMALTYAVIGVLATMLNINIQAAAQNVWVISIFCLVFAALALSMFGFYDIQLPASVQNKLVSISNNQEGGTLFGAAIMGVVSAIIVGPCVAPPLVGALVYISQTDNQLLGGLALFSMGIGMGIPLLIIGGSAGSLLPRAGKWMETVKKVFGVGLLALAIWFMARVIPAVVELYLWAALLIITAIYMGALDQLEKNASWARLWKGLGLIMLAYGVILVIGASSGSGNVYRPLDSLVGRLSSSVENKDHLSFKNIKSVADLDLELAQASKQSKAVMLDFYADWCVECIRMELSTYTTAEVHDALHDVVLLQADVTDNDEVDKILLNHFGIYGPPAIMFFGSDSQERQPYRLFGFVEAEEFADHVRQAVSL